MSGQHQIRTYHTTIIIFIIFPIWSWHLYSISIINRSISAFSITIIIIDFNLYILTHIPYNSLGIDKKSRGLKLATPASQPIPGVLAQRLAAWRRGAVESATG